MRDSMIFYKGWLKALKNTPPEQFKEAMLAILEYGIEGVEYEGEGFGEVIFNMAKGQIDANNQRYDNGHKGGRPKNHTIETEKPMVIENENHRLSETKPNKNVNDNDNDNKKVTKVTKKAGAFFPDPELDKAFNEFVEMRKKLRSPMTDRAIQLAVNRLNELSRGDPNTALTIVNQSILNGWKSFYEPKTTKSSNFNERQFDAQELERELLRGVP